ncbi:MAG TPA: M48 family metallopeptidase [Puia sp.]|nr:M48 family metallopeptidase [Puia sp.]
MTKPLYPPTPENAGGQKLPISPDFRRQVPKVIGAILLFILVYLLLVVAAVALAIFCGYLGVFLFTRLTNFPGVILGLGVVAVGISVFVFLIKFIFAVAKDEDSDRVQITETEQPRLFEFIRRLSRETGTRFPRKIFLSPSVNASVFYNSSFRSTFLPARKNLDIGLGLVNCLNLSEFKAVIAHEFGHFSQKSMRLGSFTYNVNRVIYNMLYQNKDYTAFLGTWGSFHSLLRFFVFITVKIANGIQWLLQKMYGVINKRYMGLSREMEFHADSVSASVAGSNNAISALARIDVASGCYNTALSDANQQLKQQKVARNIYSNQLIVMRTIAEEYRLPMRDRLPDFDVRFIESFGQSRINYKDQWASHPNLKDRIARLDRLQLTATPGTDSAWEIFDHPETLQETFTARLYRTLDLQSPGIYDAAEFSDRFRRERSSHALPAVFHGFFDGRYIDAEGWDASGLTDGPAPAVDVAELFSKENGQLYSAIENNTRDLELLKAIRDKKTSITSFDFDGVKYTVSGCDALIASLETEIAAQKTRLQHLDKTALRFFFHRPDIDREKLVAAFCSFQAEDLRAREFTGVVTRLLNRIQPFYAGKVSLGKINDILRQLKSTEEAELKRAYNKLLDENILTSPEEILAFVQKSYVYFHDNAFLNNELNELTGLARKTAEGLNQRRFQAYRSLLEIGAASLR